jgi:hypothetical protein
MDERDDQPPSHGAEETVRLLSEAQAYIQTLPPVERRIATLAASGMPVWEIAQQTRESEGAVWRTLDGIIAVVTGREIEPVETGGLGADTDPGVTGGYDESGFDPLDTEPKR